MNAIEFVEYLKLKSPGKQARRFNNVDKNKELARIIGSIPYHTEKTKRILPPEEWLILP